MYCIKFLFTVVIFSWVYGCSAQHGGAHVPNATQPAAERTAEYVPLLKGKRVAVFANHTSMVAGVHLIDTLHSLGVDVRRIFAPEHGFRGTADAGEKVESSRDVATGIELVSLYGKKRKPSTSDVKDIDVFLFDIQDVGVRFYTYISSLQDYLEAALEFNIPLIILDRPNPNGFYIDGPVLDTQFKSFVGMQPVPVVYGMTIGEYAKMIAGEGWLSGKANQLYKNSLQKTGIKGFSLTVIKNASYNHNTLYTLPVNPSPNLKSMSAIYWYPSTCFFEGTVLSEGRGTEHPFEIFGHPSLPRTLYQFTPTSREGAKSPKLLNQLCYGWNVHAQPEQVLQVLDGKLNLKYLLDAYKLFPNKDSFFITSKKNPTPNDYFFNKLAGNALLMQQIRDGKSETEIRKSWQPGIEKFKAIRKKYLLY